MSTIKFVTKYDYFSAILSIACFVFILLIYRNLATFVFASLILLFGLYSAFGRRLSFGEERIVVRNFIFKQKLDYSDLTKFSYTNKLYGKSVINITSSTKTHQALLGYKEWLKLKVWIEQKGIACDEN